MVLVTSGKEFYLFVLFCAFHLQIKGEPIPMSECARSDLSPATFFEVPSNHPLPSLLTLPCAEMGVQRPSSIRDVGTRERKRHQGENFEKGTENITAVTQPPPQEQHSPTHKPQSITQPRPARPPPPAIPQNVLKTHIQSTFLLLNLALHKLTAASPNAGGSDLPGGHQRKSRCS